MNCACCDQPMARRVTHLPSGEWVKGPWMCDNIYCKPETEPCPNCRGTGIVHIGECMIDEACEECEDGQVPV